RARGAQRPAVPFPAVVEAAATRVDQRYRAALEIETQPLDHELPVTYRVMLRTLHSPTFNGQVDERPYTEYHWTSYIPDPAEPDFQQLATETDAQVQIDEIPL